MKWHKVYFYIWYKNATWINSLMRLYSSGLARGPGFDPQIINKKKEREETEFWLVIQIKNWDGNTSTYFQSYILKERGFISSGSKWWDYSLLCQWKPKKYKIKIVWGTSSWPQTCTLHGPKLFRSTSILHHCLSIWVEWEVGSKEKQVHPW